MENILSELETMFYEILPDEDYLEEDPGLNEEINDIESLINNEDKDTKEKIKALLHFDNEWFPDGLTEVQQEEYRNLLDSAEEILREKN